MAKVTGHTLLLYRVNITLALKRFKEETYLHFPTDLAGGTTLINVAEAEKRIKEETKVPLLLRKLRRDKLHAAYGCPFDHEVFQ